MIMLGLTGSIGMGKSTVARMFEDEGVPVFDADAAVHRLQGPGGALVRAIEAQFPGTTGEGGVNRTALAEAVLGESEKLQRLEAMIHPAVAREREAFLELHRRAPLVVLDMVYAPLRTTVLCRAEVVGLRAVDGLAMLIGQAAHAFRLFFGADAPREHDAELRALLTS